MTTSSSSEKGQLDPDTVVQQSIIQQAQAAAAAQINVARPARQEALLEATDLITSDAAEDDMPPPAYGEIYGEIRNEKDGMGTSALVTDDGRVNIRINQLNRRLSLILTPALREHDQRAEDSRPPTSPYVPPSLGGDKGVPPPPALNVVIQVVGSRGDVQPFVALGKVLKETYGHRVRLATHPTFKNFVHENGLEFFSIGGDPSQLMAFMVKNPNLMPGFRSLMSGDVGQRRRDVAEYIQGCWRSCYKAGDGMSPDSGSDPGFEPAARPFVADCIIANPPSFAHIHCAEKLGIPLHIMFTMPYSPTQAFPHPLANIQSSNADPQLTNYISYAMIELLSWQGLGDIINRFRAKCLGLDPVGLIDAPGMLHRLKVPHTYCWSPALIPKPKDWGPHISISGFYFLNLASDFTASPGLQAFLNAGAPPVYIGFGSIVLDDPNAMTELIFEASRKSGQRVLLSKGWGGMGADELCVPESVFMLGNVPHDWLFKHVSCVVHHGGAGTTAAGITAGRPTLIVPFFGDQPFWGAMVARAGAGPNPIPHKQLTVDRLVDAINFCLKPESMERANELASKIAAERGSDMGAQSFHQHLDADRLRCTLAPSLPAAWRIKRTQVRLSTFAACTLANANLLDFHDLKLFRAQEYHTDEGPWDPISGGFTACMRAFSGMAMGVADVPTDMIKALHIPSGPSRQQSQASVSTIASKSETSHVRENPTPLPPSEQSRTSFQVQKSHAHAVSTTNLSRLSSSASTIGSSCMPDALEDQSSLNKDEISRRQFLSRTESSSSQDRDMMRQRGVHTSKGLGRFVKTFVQTPMGVSVGITRGFHNFPKLWGDDTVRPQEQVSDFKSGIRAAGKEFGYGWYDGVTGLVTQPWRGAQKDGTSGFLKGIGKGLGGFTTKPLAGLMGILGHTMKGVHKEVQKLYGSNVQNYIVASRVAQGYEEWLQSSDAEKQDVLDRWKLIQEYLKKKHSPDEMMQDMLEAQRRKHMMDKEVRHGCERTAGAAESADSADAPAQDRDTKLAMSSVQSPLRPLNRAAEEVFGATGMNANTRSSEQETSRGNTEAEADVQRAIQDSVSQLQGQQLEAANDYQDQESLRQAMASSEVEAQRHESELLAYEQQLNQAIERSLMEHGWRASDSEWVSDMVHDEAEAEQVERVRRAPEKMAEKAAAMAHGSYHMPQPPSYDQGHLAGTTQSVFKAQQQGQQGEKTTQEKTEEDIVMEYVRKQSLLEAHHRNKGKGRSTATEDEEDEQLQKALVLSMQANESAKFSGVAP
ncbi:glycosyltransferase family 1 protein [Macroventuria anomochaeta]|uniref:Glycosyltransferase family 1 protein n=1 Tax=Macroventuria anomochaeta TaxID=301207 RepID=A0ACB6RIT7_9PLEO|nr:glycosyltransferase family 1 protein [Macroventuria anomochaeta]KAF2621325.1 glycosyltransferase family 1 protein [Macroventuria anomochaeta]